MNETSELKYLLVDQILDLKTATEVFRDYLAHDNFDAQSHFFWGVSRMCINSIVLNLSKLWEIINAYGKEIQGSPEHTRKKCFQLRKELEDKKIYEFRSKYVAHISSQEKGQKRALLKTQEAETYLRNIIGKTVGDFMKFCDWVAPENGDYEASVVGIITELKEYCRTIDPNTTRP